MAPAAIVPQRAADLNRPVFRFAPSPNGRLHLGHALSALLNADMARNSGGRLLLRVEDIDQTRCRPAFEAAIFDDLHWLGVAWEQPVRRQAEHFADYRAALGRLQRMGLVVPSFASRREIAAAAGEAAAAGRPWPRDPDGAVVFPGDEAVLPAREIARRRAQDEPAALRLDHGRALAAVAGALDWQETGDRQGAGDWQAGGTGPVAALPWRWGDIVLARKETPTSYHLSVVVDDALQGVTHVVRGRDLFAATAVHRLLQSLLDLPAPLYHHHRLIVDESGRKLSKSAGDTALAALRERGLTPADIRRRVGLAPSGQADDAEPQAEAEGGGSR